MPKIGHWTTHQRIDHVVSVVIAIRAGKYENAELHDLRIALVIWGNR